MEVGAGLPISPLMMNDVYKPALNIFNHFLLLTSASLVINSEISA
ncbi:hypothetical protein NSP_18850 [Nodularia spumigena CCY9414]|nr:hypothetical protein NSP_18850 [Nodularia spumigena CCY9414]